MGRHLLSFHICFFLELRKLVSRNMHFFKKIMLINDPLNLAPLVAVLRTFNVIRYQHKNGLMDIRLFWAACEAVLLEPTGPSLGTSCCKSSKIECEARL